MEQDYGALPGSREPSPASGPDASRFDPARGHDTIYVLFSDDGKHVRRWSLQAFEGATQFWSAACACVEVAGEDPFCALHGETQ